MKAKSIILIVIAGGCGLVASIGISQVIMRDGGGGGEVATTPILVAAHDLDIGDKLDENSVNIEEWPVDRVPEGVLTKLEDIVEDVPNSRLYKGEPILAKKLVGNLADMMPAIPEGYRVGVLRVNPGMLPPNILPGDRVDVSLVLRKGGDIRFTGTKTILKNVRLYAVNSQTDRVVEDGNVHEARTISVLVTPEQFEMLMLANELGKVRLAQRRHNDTSDDVSDVFDISELFSRPAENADETITQDAPKDVNAGNSFKEFLEQQAGSNTEAAGLQNARRPSEPKFRLIKHTPEGIVEYRWYDEEQLPEIVMLGQTGTPAAAPSAPAMPAAPTPDDLNSADGDAGEGVDTATPDNKTTTADQEDA